jgi:2-polyprenyl-3-methyl-5-hydroxy-6-metoxy-1,4-benzoquinol methylase
LDVIVSVDAFEHFADPAEVLRIMDKLLSLQARPRQLGRRGITPVASVLGISMGTSIQREALIDGAQHSKLMGLLDSMR